LRLTQSRGANATFVFHMLDFLQELVTGFHLLNCRKNWLSYYAILRPTLK
jgi:hypothetical protein